MQQTITQLFEARAEARSTVLWFVHHPWAEDAGMCDRADDIIAGIDEQLREQGFDANADTDTTTLTAFVIEHLPSLRGLVFDGKFIQAIHTVRNATGLPLRRAKAVVDSLR